MKKSERIAALMGPRAVDEGAGLHPCYLGYFDQFNTQRYYEAHDVLEHLWLEKKDENHSFYKGLIQVAGAFVHLQKQFQHPTHPKHSRRLQPAARLFDLAVANLERFRPVHLALDVESLCELCLRMIGELERSHFSRNPWAPAIAPRLDLQAVSGSRPDR